MDLMRIILVVILLTIVSACGKRKLPEHLEDQRKILNLELFELKEMDEEKSFSSFEEMLYKCEGYKDGVLEYKRELIKEGYEDNFNQKALEYAIVMTNKYKEALDNYNKNKKLGGQRYLQELEKQRESTLRVNQMVDEMNKVPEYNGASTKGRDYYVGEDGRIYENKACGYCLGAGIIESYDMITSKKKSEVCNACKGIGQMSY